MLPQKIRDSKTYQGKPVDRNWARNLASTLSAPDILVTMGGATTVLQLERQAALGQGKSGPVDLSYF